MRQDSEVEMIRNHVARFRNAIDRARRDDWKGNMSIFPTECCHHGCALLLVYLRQLGLEGFRTFCGHHPTEKERVHQWLQKGNIVVDITADQFAGVEERAVVSRDSSWHAALKGQVMPLPTNPTYNDEMWDFYADIYQDILACLSQGGSLGEGKSCRFHGRFV